jgi:CheY-like chemotaxis protein
LAQHEVPARILIVDDDDRSRATTAALLRGSGNLFAFAASGDEAIEQAVAWRPDLVLLDVMMPGIDGLEVCRRVRAEPRLADVRICMLTALDDQQTRRTAFECGADHFFTKPLERQEALVRLRGLARANRFRQLVALHRELRALVGPSTRRAPAASDALAAAFDRALANLEVDPHPVVHVAEDGSLRVMGHAMEIGPPVPETGEPATAVAYAAAIALDRLDDLARAVRSRTAELAEEHPATTPLLLATDLSQLRDPSLFSPDEPLANHASRVVLELEERGPRGPRVDVGQRVASLRELGYRVALGGFGAESASLDALSSIQPDMVRLDPAAAAVLARPEHAGWVARMVAACGDLGITLIVDGVTTREQSRALRAAGAEFQHGPLHTEAARGH